MVGAGGACQSILLALLKAGARISLLNRTMARVAPLVARFGVFGEIKPFAAQTPTGFDLVITSISEFNPSLMQSIAVEISPTTFCYDLNYGQRANDFMAFAKNCGAQKLSDGKGMLIGQAAHSYQLWTGERPDIDGVDC